MLQGSLTRYQDYELIELNIRQTEGVGKLLGRKMINRFTCSRIAELFIQKKQKGFGNILFLFSRF